MKIVLLALTISLMPLAGCGASGDEPGLIVLPGMHYPVPPDAHDVDPVLGQTLRLPPVGTVPAGATVYDYGPGETEAARAGVELMNPILSSKKDSKRGAEQFRIYCQVCHGPAGDGDGPIIGRFPNPPSLRADKARNLSDGHLFHVISHGQGIMAPYARQILAEDRWRIVHHIRDLQGAKQ